MRLRDFMRRFRRQTGELWIAGQTEIITNRLLSLMVLSEAELEMAMSMLSAVRVAISAIGTYTRMTMWPECRGLIIRHRGQSRTPVMNADELMATAIQRSWSSSPLGTIAIVEAISTVGV